SIDLYSTHVPTSFADSIRIGAATGINTASITTPSLMMHMAASNAILQLTDRQGKMNAREVLDKTYKAYKVLRGVRSATTTGASSTTSGRITATEALIKGFKETYGLDEEEKNSDAKSSSSSATTGGPMGDPDDEEGKKKSGEKQYEIPESQEGLQKFIEEAERAGSGLKSDPFHRASTFGGQPQAQIEVQKIVGGDGQSYVRLTQQATLNDLEGYFEYLVNSEGQITHQLFKVK
nr:hypothetical protein [Pseudomonadota bacterium]